MQRAVVTLRALHGSRVGAAVRGCASSIAAASAVSAIDAQAALEGREVATHPAPTSDGILAAVLRDAAPRRALRTRTCLAARSPTLLVRARQGRASRTTGPRRIVRRVRWLRRERVRRDLVKIGVKPTELRRGQATHLTLAGCSVLSDANTPPPPTQSTNSSPRQRSDASCAEFVWREESHGASQLALSWQNRPNHDPIAPSGRA